MNIQDVIFGFFGGLAIFLFGMNSMSDGLKNIGSDSLKKILKSLTHNRLVAIIMGMIITCIIQSSSATSVMAVGFVNAGLLGLEQAVAVVLGADIGTTVTAWLVSAMGIGKLKMSTYALPIIAIGFLIQFMAKKQKTKMIGQTLLGFGFLFLGLGTMSAGVKSIKDSDIIMQFFARCGDNPFLGIFAGTLATMVVQSSSVTIAIVQVMAFQGIIHLDAALLLLLGNNIGTTITAQLAAIGGTRKARALANANTLFKIFGTAIFIPLLLAGWFSGPLRYFIPDQIVAETGTNSVIMIQIAVAHSAFNIINTAIFAVLLWPLLLNISNRLSRFDFGKTKTSVEEETRYLDPLLINTPPIALEQCVREVGWMVKLGHRNVNMAFSAFMERKSNEITEIEKREDIIDQMQADTTAFLVKLSRKELTYQESQQIARLIHCINDAERVGDLAENIIELADRALATKENLSESAKQDLRSYYDLVDRQFLALIRALRKKDPSGLGETLQLETQINEVYVTMAQHNECRIEEGKCAFRCSVLFLEVLDNLEKVGDRLSNIAERIDVTS